MLLKIIKSFFFPLMRLISLYRPYYGTILQFHFYRKLGLVFGGKPNFIASSVWFDSTDYSLISLGGDVTISGDVVFLTHDWALHTVGKGLNPAPQKIGRVAGISVGDYSFIGIGSIILPGAKIGRCCIIGAGSVVRGFVPDYSIVVGNPAVVVKDVRDYANSWV